MFAVDLLPPDAHMWNHSINLKLESPDYEVSFSEDNNWIVLDPLEKHESTIIWLHGITGRGDQWFNLFAHKGIAPKTSRIILP